MQAHSRFGAPLKQSHFSFVRLCLRIFNSSGRLFMYFTYKRCKFGHYNESCAREKVTRCSKVVKDFMTKNCFKLNSNETQFLSVTKYFAHTDFEPPVLYDNTVTCISPSAGIRNFGVIFDCSLPFILRQSRFYQLQRIKSIQSYLPHNTLKLRFYHQ